jgi:hypothetical protein
MSSDIAATLADTVAQRRSFVVTAVPRLAGKTTVMRAMLGELPRNAPIRAVGIDGDDIDDLVAQSRGGYIVIPEIAEGPWAPGYIRGAPVRRIFHAIGAASLATALHAPDPDTTFAVICGANRVPDDDAAKISLVVYLRSLGGDWRAPRRRVVATVHAIDGVRGGRPRARLLHHWNEQRDRFESA